MESSDLWVVAEECIESLGSQEQIMRDEDRVWHAEAATVNASELDGIVCTRNVLDLSRDQAWVVPAAYSPAPLIPDAPLRAQECVGVRLRWGR